MESLITWLKGKKTYGVALVAAILAFIQALGYPIPEWVYVVLGALGLVAARAAISKLEGSDDAGA